MKTIAIAAGLYLPSHIGLLGYVMRPPNRQYSNPYIQSSQWDLILPIESKADKDGYEIEYRANDPKVLESSKSMTLD